ncbi:MAG: AAA family ATPase [Ignavibacteria bacterium]|nr:AAA family ATPase [Ignavibacteria bacterium]
MDDSIKATKERLLEIEKELDELRKAREKLRAQWELEKSIIQQIRDYKAQIENLRYQADEYERQGNLAKVAEIRYGLIHELQKKLNEASSKLEEIQKSGKLLKEEVDAEDIAEIVSKWTGIPVNKMLESERSKLLKMEERIHLRLVDQEEAVRAVANAIRRSRVGLQDVNRPIGSFIFLGSTGVGKTELARSLAEFLFDDENAMVRIDMSEYMERFSVSRLVGAPPGYVGYEEGGQLTEAVRRRPYSVVLLDEIEKAHPDVFNILLQVLDDGRLTDSKGRVVNFKNTIVIMTSNLGTELIQERLEYMTSSNREEVMERLKDEIFELLKKRLRPEFLNRIDDIIVFKPLTKNEIVKIALLQIEKIKGKLKENGIDIQITNDALDLISAIGFDPQFGARPLKRAIQKLIVDKLALLILERKFSQGDKVLIDAKDGEFIFSKI